MILFAVALAVLLLVVVIDWHGLLIRYFANNPNRGRIFIRSGKEYISVKGKRGYMAEDGDVFMYRFNGMELVVVVPWDYPIEYVEGRRIIFVNDGGTVALPFGFGEVKSLGVCDVSAVTQGQVVVEVVKALTGKGGIPWMWIAIAIGVAVVGYFVWSMMGGGVAPVEPELPPGIID